MTANPILLQKKYSRVIECFARQQEISLDAALDFFYHSQVYQLIRDGVSDMHCMSDAYLAEELKQEYGKVSRIILQPHGVHGINSQLKYCLQYDVKNAEFIPSTRYQYDENDIDYIEHHINQFRLNDIGFKTNALVEFLEDVINADGKYREKKKYSNYIVDLFMEKLKDFSQTDILKLCENLYTQYFLEFRSE